MKLWLSKNQILESCNGKNLYDRVKERIVYITTMIPGSIIGDIYRKHCTFGLVKEDIFLFIFWFDQRICISISSSRIPLIRNNTSSLLFFKSFIFINECERVWKWWCNWYVNYQIKFPIVFLKYSYIYRWWLLWLILRRYRSISRW